MNGRINGSVNIRVQRDLKVIGVQPIVLDINKITVLSTKVLSSATELPFDVSYGQLNNSFHITLKTPSPDLNALEIQLFYVGHLSDTMQGVYRGEYKDTENDKVQSYVSTQFSPIDARNGFPCFDRPDKKAIFNISLIRPLTMNTYLSNMRHVSSGIYRHGYAIETFAPTQRMPTYLVAFHLSNLHKSDVAMEAAVDLPQINVYARREVSSMTRFAYEFTTNILTYLQNYFNVKLNLDKIDLIAVPDFGFNAMENTGMVTFK